MSHIHSQIYFSLNPLATIKRVSDEVTQGIIKKQRDKHLSWRLTCVTLTEDSHGLSTHCVHSEGMLPWNLQ